MTKGAGTEEGAGAAPSAAPSHTDTRIKHRMHDLGFVTFFVTMLFLTYTVDFEILTIDTPDKFQYPCWPPKMFVDMMHSYGRNYDPAILGRPTWLKAIIWMEVMFIGPVCATGLYAFLMGKEWIRVPMQMLAGVMFTCGVVSLREEHYGLFASPHFVVVSCVYGAWLLMSLLLMVRMRNHHPFQKVPEHSTSTATSAADATVERPMVRYLSIALLLTIVGYVVVVHLHTAVSAFPAYVTAIQGVCVLASLANAGIQVAMAPVRFKKAALVFCTSAIIAAKVITLCVLNMKPKMPLVSNIAPAAVLLMATSLLYCATCTCLCCGGAWVCNKMHEKKKQ